MEFNILFMFLIYMQLELFKIILLSYKIIS